MKMVGDMDKALERATFFYQDQIEKGAQGSWMAALWTERKLNEQRKEYDNTNTSEV